MQVKIEAGWQQVLAPQFNSAWFTTLAAKVKEEYATKLVYPPGKLMFNAFDSCPWEQTKVVILGQDPYHGPGQAHGLAFSVNDGVPLPPSLQNIYKELASDVGKLIPTSGNLTHWGQQGVLLLNTVLTVRAHTPASHQGYGWERLTDAAIEALSQQKQHLVFLLWGSHAQKKIPLIDKSKHLILTAPHPSPLSAHRGFMGCKHFSQTNNWLKSHGLPLIEW